MKNYSIPRCFFNGKMVYKAELHTFADASDKAFASVSYWRVTYLDYSVSVTLVTSKSSDTFETNVDPET